MSKLASAEVKMRSTSASGVPVMVVLVRCDG